MIDFLYNFLAYELLLSLNALHELYPNSIHKIVTGYNIFFTVLPCVLPAFVGGCYIANSYCELAFMFAHMR